MNVFNKIIFILLLCQNFAYSQLNKEIDKSQKQAVKNSPFLKSSKAMSKELKWQFRQRLQYLNIIDSLRKNNPNDTLILVENYDFICFGCPADLVQVFIKDKYIELRTDSYESLKYKIKNHSLNGKYNEGGNYLSDIRELKLEISKSDYWNLNPKKYGSDECFDGGHTFYSVIYPSNKIVSMYMRCWEPIEYRNEEE